VGNQKMRGWSKLFGGQKCVGGQNCLVDKNAWVVKIAWVALQSSRFNYSQLFQTAEMSLVSDVVAWGTIKRLVRCLNQIIFNLRVQHISLHVIVRLATLWRITAGTQISGSKPMPRL